MFDSVKLDNKKFYAKIQIRPYFDHIRHITSQYTNNRVMILKDHRKIESESDRSNDEEVPPLEV
jgi:hypothetical protein